MKNLYLSILLICSASLAVAQQTADCSGAGSHAYLEINNIKVRLGNGGNFLEFYSDPPYVSYVPTYIVGTKTFNDSITRNLTTIFANAIWLGAIDETSENLKVAALTYRQSGNDFWPGPIHDETKSTNFEQCKNYNRHWKVNKTTIDKFTNDLSLNDEEKKELYEWPGKGNTHLEFDLLNQTIAPFNDVNGDDIYNPDDGDYPRIKGDQAVWWIINDIGNEHTETGGEAFGVEIKKMAYAFKSEQKLENSTFFDVEITNKSNNNYKDFLLGNWIDFCLGNYNDDFVGCDTANAIGYVYNGDDFDNTASGFGYEIPIQGSQFLYVPPGFYGTENKMYAFVNYFGGFSDISEPYTAPHYYTYLKGKWKNGMSLTVGGTGTNDNGLMTSYMYSGNPSNPNGWSECSAGNEPTDRRIIMSSGKYKFASGETKTWTIGSYTIPNVGGTCPNIQPLIDQAKYAKAFHDRFVLTDVEINFENKQAFVYPNPTKSKLYLNSPTPIKSIEVYDLGGKLILQKNIKKNYLEVEDLEKGIYHAKLYNNNVGFYLVKFLKR